MTNLPDDLLDPAEGRLVRRVGAYADRAVIPIDPMAIAASAAVAARRRPLAERLLGQTGPGPRAGARARLALIGAGTVLAVAGLGVVITGGAAGLFGPHATPTAAPVALRPCTPEDVDVLVTAWDGAAGSRIATVELRQVGGTACAIAPLPQPWLADGNGRQLITGKAGAGAPMAIQPRDVLHTLVEASNYCGPDPVAPVTVAFTQGEAVFVATALTPTDLSGVPPCNSPGTSAPAVIAMHPWAPGPSSE